jgi:hypothetical protein
MLPPGVINLNHDEDGRKQFSRREGKAESGRRSWLSIHPTNGEVRVSLPRLLRRLQNSTRAFLPAKHPAVLDDFDNGRGHIVFPGGIAGLEFGEHERREEA